MTRDRPHSGSLSRRLLLAFTFVALVSVLMLTLAALVGTDRGLSAAQTGDRQQVADRAAAAAGEAYAAADGWAGADLSAAQAVADGADAGLVVRDAGGTMMSTMMGQAHGAQHSVPGRGQGSSGPNASAPVIVDGEQVGGVTLVFGPPAETGRGIAWAWVAGAAALALALALTVSGYVARRLTRPLVSLTRTARAFASGDRKARSQMDEPGEIGELAAAFDTMAASVVHAEQVRRRLAADVAHELRTPLAALQAGLEELRDGLVEPRPDRLGGLHDQALRLGRVVDDLATLSAAESAALSLHMADTDLAAIAAAAVDSQEPALRAAGLELTREIEASVPLRADADRLHQAVGNVLANSARYCRPGDRVTVRVANDDGAALVEVADTGPGIDPDDLPHVFDRMRRGRSSESVAGSGIGLAVVRELVTAHGGTVSARSEPGRGATFTIRVPTSS